MPAQVCPFVPTSCSADRLVSWQRTRDNEARQAASGENSRLRCSGHRPLFFTYRGYNKYRETDKRRHSQTIGIPLFFVCALLWSEIYHFLQIKARAGTSAEPARPPCYKQYNLSCGSVFYSPQALGLHIRNIVFDIAGINDLEPESMEGIDFMPSSTFTRRFGLIAHVIAPSVCDVDGQRTCFDCLDGGTGCRQNRTQNGICVIGVLPDRQ